MSHSFGQKLSKYRNLKGFTQEELARRAGLSKDHIAKLERGEKTNPRVDTIKAIAEALEIDDALLLARPRFLENERTSFPTKNSIIRKIDIFISTLPKDEQARIMHLFAQFADLDKKDQDHIKALVERLSSAGKK